MTLFDPYGGEQYVTPYGMQVDAASDSAPEWVLRHYIAHVKPDYLLGAAIISFLEYATAGDKCPESLYRVESLVADRLMLEAEIPPAYSSANGIVIGDVCRAFRTLIGQDEDAVLYALDAWRQAPARNTAIRTTTITVLSNYIVNVGKIEPRIFK